MIQSALVRALCGATLGATLVTAPAAFAGDHATGDKAKHDKTTHNEGAAAEHSSVQGTVEAVTPSSITLKEHDGSSRKVELDKDTTYHNAGKAGSVKDLRAGMTVTIRCDKEKDGSLRADSVRYGQSG